MSYPFRIRVIGDPYPQAAGNSRATALVVARGMARYYGQPIRIDADRDSVWIAHAIVTPDGEVSYPADQIDPPEER